MPLDPEFEALQTMLLSLDVPPMSSGTAAQAREMYRLFLALPDGVEPDHVAAVDDRTIPGPAGDIPIRVYRAEDGDAPRPLIVYFHGGGWTIGDLETHDPVCRTLAASVGAVVVAVDYRLAPEHPFPAAVEDADAAVQWAAAHAGELGGDPGRVVVGGDSAGGNLAAVVARHARDRGGPPIAAQLLVYPSTDLTSMDTDSHRENADRPFLHVDTMTWFRNNYVPDVDRRAHPDASPSQASDLSGLPPAVVVTAEFDPLRDEGEAYAEQLRAAGVDVRARRFEGLPHGFNGFAPTMKAPRLALEQAYGDLRELLES
jgi:acetyl esterase